MNLRLSTPHSALRTPRSVRGFTMVEIALSLAIIGFALVAIIGVLPAGMSVQKDNREQTIINLDAAYLMDAIRSGPLGQDDLTNYIVSIGQTNTLYQGKPGQAINTLTAAAVHTYVFTTNTPNGTFIDGVASAPCLTSGFNIIGLLSTPKYAYFYPQNEVVLWNTSVSAIFRAINAPVVDQGGSQTSRDFAFQYQVTVEIVPSAESAYMSQNGSWVNVTAPNYINITNPSPPGTTDLFAQHLQNNLYDIQLTFRWPVLPNGQLGGGRQVFRSSVAGTYMPTNSPPLPPPYLFTGPTPYPVGWSYLLPNRAYLFFMQPATYTPQ